MRHIRFRAGMVRAVREEGPGWQHLEVEVWEPGRPPQPAEAWHDAELLGPLRPGDRVILNTTAVWLGLGTGGFHFVYWVPGREQIPDVPAVAPVGHLMKLRYTPGQMRVAAVEEQEGAQVALPPGADPAGALEAMPVVVGTLHSQLLPVLAGLHSAFPGIKVAYVMTDGGALPAPFSRLVRRLRQQGLLDRVITCGHAYGGDEEAVSPASALLAARKRGVHAAVALMGPGVVGTGTALGTSALEAAALLDTAAALGGTPLLALRAGEADRRPRHRGISHHALTVLRLARSAALIALPWGGTGRRLAQQLQEAGLAACHPVCYVNPAPALRLMQRWGISASTMGRGWAEEPLFFATAAAAGLLAGGLAGRRQGGTPHG